ncbi:MAG: flavin reductase family protein [Bacteroidetes bacterium]|nr:flavin reductase family protein [Bacteroidota bacterium]MDA0903533.1 flavin reductase family protein [Bacteroidota bacterium]MDA1241882.1 flavin reductase family protein [Bacteroidota bacterium]
MKSSSEVTSLRPQDVDARTLHGFLLGGIAPRPIAFVSSMDAMGRVNLAPFSYFNVFSANPPWVIFSPARRGRDATTKHTWDNVQVVPEVVVNLVDYAMVHACSLASTDFDAGVDEFVKAGLTPLASMDVRPPRVAESPIQLECRVVKVESLGDQGGAGQLVFAEIVRIHARGDVLNASGLPDATKLDLVGRCGGDHYVRASGEALFEVPKPLGVPGMGVDALPEDIRTSDVLTGNQLAMLGGCECMPDETDVNEYKLLELSDVFMRYEGEGVELERALHARAAQLLDNGLVDEAWKTLLAFNAG